MTCPAKHENGELRHPWTTKDDLGLLARFAGDQGKLVIASFGEDIFGSRKIKPVIRHFASDEVDQMVADAERLGQERCRNVYVMFGTVRPDLRDDLKGGEKDVVGVFGLVADFDAKGDPDAGKWRERLPMEPTMVLRTSTDPEPSYQCRYLFTKPILMERAKRIAVKLQAACGCDAATQDVSHVWRFAGGTNWPNRDKVEKHGRPPKGQLVEVELPYSEDRLVDPDELERLLADVEVAGDERATNRTAAKVDPTEVRRLRNVDDLDEWGVSQRTKMLIVQGTDQDDPTKYESRSEPLWFVCNELVRAGCDDETIYSVLMDPDFGISASVLDKGASKQKYAVRQIERAREANEDFDTDDNGKPYKTIANVRRAIAKLGVGLEYDEFVDRPLVHGLDGFGPTLDDKTVNHLWLATEERFGLSFPKEKFSALLGDQALKTRRHPVCEYLATLKWDDKKRLDRFLIDYFGAPDTEYVREVGAITLVAAVRRARRPGCKYDEMLVLEGHQGTEKSTGLMALVPVDDWFSDDLPLNVDTAKFIEATSGRWIIEAADLKGLRKSEVESLKATLSRRVDRARLAWGRAVKEAHRQCIIIGTTNAERYLRDVTGNRRFWPVATGKVDVKALRRDRDQLWAEAAYREAQGESIRLDPRFWGSAAREQEKREVEDPWLPLLSELLGEYESGKIPTEDVWDIVGLQSGHRKQEHNDRLGDVMRKLGWEHDQLRWKGTKAYCYWKGDKKPMLFSQRGEGNRWTVSEQEPPF